MEGQIITALVLAIPITLIPAAVIWYLNIGGLAQAIREARAKKAAVKVTK